MEDLHFYTIKLLSSFDIHYNPEEVTDGMYDEIKEDFRMELENTLDFDALISFDDADWNDVEHDLESILYVSSELDKTEVLERVQSIVDDIQSISTSSEILDGTYYDTAYVFDTPPYERIYNTKLIHYDVTINSEIQSITETDEDGNLIENVTVNELKDRAQVHRQHADGLSPFCSLSECDNSEDMPLDEEKKKRRKSLYNINYNAGNVEHNINMFNKMNSPAAAPSTNPVSGPFGGDTGSADSAGGIGESLQTPDNAKYIVDKFNWSPEEVTVTCYDKDADKPFEKFLCAGVYDEDTGRRNALMLLKDTSFHIPLEIRNELISTYGLDDFGFKIEESLESSYQDLDDKFDMSMRTIL